MIGPYVSQAAHVEHRKYSVLADCFVQCGNQMHLGDCPFPEELFHELVFSFSNKLHEGLMRSLCIRLDGFRNRGDLTPAVAVWLVQISLHRYQVHYTVKAMLIDDGKLDRHQLPSPLF